MDTPSQTGVIHKVLQDEGSRVSVIPRPSRQQVWWSSRWTSQNLASPLIKIAADRL